jgi:hypothetical protein
MSRARQVARVSKCDGGRLQEAGHVKLWVECLGER